MIEQLSVAEPRQVTTRIQQRDLVTKISQQQITSKTSSRDAVSSTRNSLVTRDRPQRQLVSKGQVGPAGLSGGTVPAIGFSFGDATPATIFTCTSNAVLTQVSVVIDTVFNGASPSIKVSVGAVIVMPTSENDPTQAAEYQAAPALAISHGDQVALTIIPGAGATAGSGRIFLEFT